VWSTNYSFQRWQPYCNKRWFIDVCFRVR